MISWFIAILVIIAFLIYKNKPTRQNYDEYIESLYVTTEEEIKSEIEKDNDVSDEIKNLMDTKDEESYNENLLSRLYKARKDYLILRTRFSGDNNKITTLNTDWGNYLLAIGAMTSAMQMLHVDMSENATENFQDSLRDNLVIADAVEYKFKQLISNN